MTDQRNICYCGEYGGGVHTRSARCPGGELRTLEGEPALTQSSGLPGTREPVVTAPQGNAGESPPRLLSSKERTALEHLLRLARDRHHGTDYVGRMILMESIAATALSDDSSAPEPGDVPAVKIAGDAEARFMLWLMKEIPAGTVISSPTWWSPRIFKAVLRAIEVQEQVRPSAPETSGRLWTQAEWDLKNKQVDELEQEATRLRILLRRFMNCRSEPPGTGWKVSAGANAGDALNKVYLDSKKYFAGSPVETGKDECQHDLLKPGTTIEVIDQWKAKCKVCVTFFDLPGRPADGWKCITCGHENPKGALRCQNTKCTVLSYSPENGKGD